MAINTAPITPMLASFSVTTVQPPDCSRRPIGRSMLLSVVLAITSAGCGRQSEPRLALTGSVTVDSQSVAQGSISFLPTDRTEGPATSTAIVAGSYQFGYSNGPYPGTYRVLVGVDQLAATVPSDPKLGLRLPSGEGESAPQQWESRCELAENGDSRQDFTFSTPAANP